MLELEVGIGVDWITIEVAGFEGGEVFELFRRLYRFN